MKYRGELNRDYPVGISRTRNCCETLLNTLSKVVPYLRFDALKCQLTLYPGFRTDGASIRGMIPFGFPFHMGERGERDLITSLHGRSRGTCIFVSGFLLFTLPMFLGLILSFAYDRPCPSRAAGQFLTSEQSMALVILALGGIAIGNRIWKKAQLF